MMKKQWKNKLAIGVLALSLIFPGIPVSAAQDAEESTSAPAETTEVCESSPEPYSEPPETSAEKTDPTDETSLEGATDPTGEAPETTVEPETSESSEETLPEQSSETETTPEEIPESSSESMTETVEAPEETASESPAEAETSITAQTEASGVSGEESSEAVQEPESTVVPEESAEASGEAEAAEESAAEPETEPTEEAAETCPAEEAAEATESAEAAPEESAEESLEEEESEPAEESEEESKEETEEETTEAPLPKHDLTPIWHEEWLGKGELYRLGVFGKADVVLYRARRTLNVHEGMDTASNIIGELEAGAVVRMLSSGNLKWYYVEAKDEEGEILRGYVGSMLLKKVVREPEDPALVHILSEENAAFGDVPLSTYEELIASEDEMLRRGELVNYALEFLGNPYVWGGESLTHGADCSGFVRGVYREFGISLPRCSYEQCYSGIRIPVDEAKPGDLLFYANGRGVYHVMICYSNDGEGHIEVVHARDEKRGIVVSGLNYAIACWATTYEYFYEKEETPKLLQQDLHGEMMMRLACKALRNA